MSRDADPKDVASTCLAAWTEGDLGTARKLLHDDVTFIGPLGHTEGADAYIDGVHRMARIVERVEQQAAFSDGDDVCIVYNLITKSPPATVPTAGWYKVRDGKIASVRAFFDPRPIAVS